MGPGKIYGEYLDIFLMPATAKIWNLIKAGKIPKFMIRFKSANISFPRQGPTQKYWMLMYVNGLFVTPTSEI